MEPDDEVTRQHEPFRRVSAGTRFNLVVLQPGGQTERFPLVPGTELTLGRATDARVQLPDGEVSRRHAKLRVGPRSVAIVDLRSRNGTRVQGELIELERVLRLGEVVSIGRFVLWLEDVLQAGAEDAFQTGSRRKQLPASLESLAHDSSTLLARAQSELFASPGGRRLIVVQVVALRATVDLAQKLASDLAQDTGGTELVAVARDEELILLAPAAQQTEAEHLACRMLRLVRQDAPRASLGFVLDFIDAAGLSCALEAARDLALAALPGAIAGRGPQGKSGFCLATHGGRLLVLSDAAAQATYRRIFALASSNDAVLLLGETGTGKDEAALKFHEWSGRRGPLVTVNCAEIPKSLLAAELFGHCKGAFTDARDSRPGLVERAEGGTLFLDELGEFSGNAQAVLLRFVENREVRPVGSGGARRLDVQIVAATTKPVDQIRTELRYRFTVVELPPLRARLDDVGPMARTFLHEACVAESRPPLTLSPSALQRLGASTWPGNVRELKARMYALARTAPNDVVEAADLDELSLTIRSAALEPLSSPGVSAARPRKTLREIEREIERAEMARALAETGGNLKRSARMLGVAKNTLKRRLVSHGMRAAKPRP